jgi:hypothetical protein
MTTILGVTAVLLLLANILQAVAAIANKGKVQDTLLELHHAYKDLSTAIAERDQAKAESQQADHLRDLIERAAKEVEADRDEWKRAADNLWTERKSLYFRNRKGQIEPITPKPRKPHTLKHGMTVKDPSHAIARRIFREAKRAGIHIEDLTGGADVYVLVFSSKETNLAARDAILVVPTHVKEATYISASEFIKRINGQVA